jgi:hypothetical protein
MMAVIVSAISMSTTETTAVAIPVSVPMAIIMPIVMSSTIMTVAVTIAIAMAEAVPMFIVVTVATGGNEHRLSTISGVAVRRVTSRAVATIFVATIGAAVMVVVSYTMMAPVVMRHSSCWDRRCDQTSQHNLQDPLCHNILLHQV